MRLPPTARQGKILELLEQGFKPQQIADLLGISVHTVRTHVERVMDRLGIGTQEALRYYFWKNRIRRRMEDVGLHKSVIDEILEEV